MSYGTERIRKAREAGRRRDTGRKGEVRETGFPVKPHDADRLQMRENAHFVDQTGIGIWWAAEWNVSTWGV